MKTSDFVLNDWQLIERYYELYKMDGNKEPFIPKKWIYNEIINVGVNFI